MCIDEDRITIKEAANLLKVHRITLRKWISDYESIQEKLDNGEQLTSEEKKYRCPPFGRMGSMIIFSKKRIKKFLEETLPKDS